MSKTSSKCNYTIDDFAKYPFLPECLEYLKQKDLPIRKILLSDMYNDLLCEAEIRIDAAGSGTKYDRRMSHICIIDSMTYPTDVLVFIICVIILKASKLHLLSKKFALGEAKRTGRYLERDLKSGYKHELDILYDITANVFSMPIYISDMYNNNHDHMYGIDVIKYITAASDFNEKEWKLVNRLVHGGYVYLTEHEVIRLLQRQQSEYIQKIIKGVNVPQDHTKNNNGMFVKVIKHLQTKYPDSYMYGAKNSINNIKAFEDYPPCIQHIVASLQQGQNISHTGRFLLASYMLQIGMDIPDIISFFKNAPDYNYTISKYQITNINSRKYNCPSCDKITTNGLCKKNTHCTGIITPLQFRRKNSKLV
jgi:DNA primase large subunit